MEIKRFNLDFSICRAGECLEIPGGEFVFTAKTDEEISLVCPTPEVPDGVTDRSDGWKMLRIQGVLDFSLVGILARISSVLAEQKIGIFAVSTYNTDYIFVKKEDFERALSALEKDGNIIL